MSATARTRPPRGDPCTLPSPLSIPPSLKSDPHDLPLAVVGTTSDVETAVGHLGSAAVPLLTPTLWVVPGVALTAVALLRLTAEDEDEVAPAA